jgi:hypothetical protein
MPKQTARGQPRRHLEAATAGQVVAAEGGATTRICTKTDASAVFESFTGTLTAPETP